MKRSGVHSEHVRVEYPFLYLLHQNCNWLHFIHDHEGLQPPTKRMKTETIETPKVIGTTITIDKWPIEKSVVNATIKSRTHPQTGQVESRLVIIAKDWNSWRSKKPGSVYLLKCRCDQCSMTEMFGCQ